MKIKKSHISFSKYNFTLHTDAFLYMYQHKINTRRNKSLLTENHYLGPEICCEDM